MDPDLLAALGFPPGFGTAAPPFTTLPGQFGGGEPGGGLPPSAMAPPAPPSTLPMPPAGIGAATSGLGNFAQNVGNAIAPWFTPPAGMSSTPVQPPGPGGSPAVTSEAQAAPGPMTGAGVPYASETQTLGQILGGGNAYQAPGTAAGIQGGNAAAAPLSLAPPNPGSMAGVSGGGIARPNPASALQNAARGVQMMQPPAPQKVATPHAPPIKAMDPGQLVQMFTALGVSPQDLMRMRLARGV